METNVNPAMEKMRAAVDAAASGDIEAMVNCFPEDLVWHIPGGKGSTFTYHGHDGLREFLERFFSRTPAGARLSMDDILASDRHGVAFLRMTLDDDAQSSMSLVHFAALDSNGEFTHNWFLPSDWQLAYEVIFDGQPIGS